MNLTFEQIKTKPYNEVMILRDYGFISDEAFAQYTDAWNSDPTKLTVMMDGDLRLKVTNDN
jgi:hypothetical protein